MTEPALPPPDPIAEAYAADVLKAVPASTYEEVIKGVLAAEGSLNDKIKMAFDSGVMHAAESVFVEFRGMVDSAIDAMVDNVRGMDEVLKTLPPEHVTAVGVWRNQLAEFIHDHAVNETCEEKLARVTEFYAVPERYLKPECDIAALGVDTAASLIKAISTAYDFAFPAYLTFRSSEMPCKCPGHVLDAWKSMDPISTALMMRQIMHAYPPGSDVTAEMLALFVAWWLKHGQEAYAHAVKEGDDALPPKVSEAESALVAQDALSRIMSMKGASDDTE